jgi:HEAT repeat protein
MTAVENIPPENRQQGITLKDRMLAEWERVLAAEGISLTTEGLISALNSPHLSVRTGSAVILGRRQEIAALPYLKALLEDQPMVRVEAAMTLVLLGDESGKIALIKMLDDPLLTGSPVTAAGYLAVSGDPRGYQVVLQALNHDLAGIRLTAAVALRSFSGYHGREVNGNRIDLFDTVKKALKDPSGIVRRELLYVLAGLAEAGVAAVLSRIARSDSNQGVRLVARHLSYLKKRTKN